METRIQSGHFKFEVPLRYPDGNIKQTAGYSSLDFRREVRAKNRHMKVIGINMVLKDGTG